MSNATTPLFSKPLSFFDIRITFILSKPYTTIMVYQRLIEGKYGPYNYKSVRKGQTVLSVYLGKADTAFISSKATPPSKGLIEQFIERHKKDDDGLIYPQSDKPLKAQDTPQAPKKQYSKMKIERKGKTKLKHFDRLHLYHFAKKFKIDRAEIDHSISYDENREILEKQARQNGFSQEEITGQDSEGRYWAEQYKEAKKKVKLEIIETQEDKDAWQAYQTGAKSDSVRYNPNETSAKQQEKDAEQHKKLVNRRIKKEARLARDRGATVPYSFGTMLDAGVPVDTIRKVYRPGTDIKIIADKTD